MSDTSFAARRIWLNEPRAGYRDAIGKHNCPRNRLLIRSIEFLCTPREIQCQPVISIEKFAGKCDLSSNLPAKVTRFIDSDYKVA